MIGKRELINMLVDEHYQKNVGYFVGEFEDESGQRARYPLGTLFFVVESLYPSPGFAEYAITCRHLLEVVNSHPGFRNLFIRVNGRQGKYQDIPSNSKDWVVTADTDVAAVKFN